MSGPPTQNHYLQPQEYPFPVATHVPAPPTPAPLASAHTSTSRLSKLDRTLMLGNYEVERQRAQVADYNNPIDAYHANVAISQQQMLIQQQDERERRRAERRARKLARALEQVHVQEQDRGRHETIQHRQASRRPTPYASSRSGTPSADEAERRRGGSRSKSRRRHGKSKSRRHRSQRSSRSPPSGNTSRTPSVTGHYEYIDAEEASQQALRKGKHPSAHEYTAASTKSTQNVSRGTHTSRSSPSHPSTGSWVAQPGAGAATGGDARPVRSVPSTPPDRILHDVPAIIKRTPKVVDPPVLRLEWKATSTVFMLSRSQVHFDTPNSFSEEYQRKKHDIPPGGLLKIPMPASCNAHIFPVISSYLAGNKIIPLTQAHAMLLCGEWPPTMDAYARLKIEAKLYGLRQLYRRISVFQRNPAHEEELPVDKFQLSDTRKGFPVDIEDLQALSKSRADPRVSSPQLRVTMIGAAINFMARTVQRESLGEPSLVLEYRLVVPKTVLSEAFKAFYYWNSEELPDVFELSGQLTEEECRATIFDITYVNPPDGEMDTSYPSNPRTPAPLIYKSSLEELLRALLPIFRAEEVEAPWVYDQVFTKTSFPSAPDSPRRVGWPEASSFFYTLNYGIVHGTFTFPKTVGELPVFTIRQINAVPENLLKE